MGIEPEIKKPLIGRRAVNGYVSGPGELNRSGERRPIRNRTQSHAGFTRPHPRRPGGRSSEYSGRR